MPEPLPPSFAPTYSPEFHAAVQSVRDADNLKILEIGYYIAGGMTAFFSCIFLIHFTMFLVLGLNPQFFTHANHNQSNQPPPPAFFLAGAGIIGLFILFGWTFGALQVYAGRCLRHRRSWLFIQIIAGIECAYLPWGTAIGVFTFIVLNRPSVRTLFGQS